MFCGLLLDFWVGGGVVGVGVIWVVKLIEQFVFVVLGYFQSQVVGIFYFLFFVDQDKFGVVSVYCGLMFLVYVVGYQQFYLVVFQCGDYCQCNIGVVVGCFDQYVFGLNFVVFFCFNDY